MLEEQEEEKWLNIQDLEVKKGQEHARLELRDLVSSKVPASTSECRHTSQ